MDFENLKEKKLLGAIFKINSQVKKEYRGFIQIPDLFLELTGKNEFESPKDWNNFFKSKQLILRRCLKYPFIRHVKEPPFVPEELEILDLKLLLGKNKCPICAKIQDQEVKSVTCISCGRQFEKAKTCSDKHYICEQCLAFHLKKVACEYYWKEKKCYGHECTLLQ
ncbi:MAG: hypothetical protein ACTSVI_09875 [Promethearchaeota archaeon]